MAAPARYPPRNRRNSVFRAEHQSADGGVQAIGPDDQVEPGGGGVLERHRDAVGLLGDGADRVLEQVLGVASGRLIEDGGQLAAHDLDVPAGDARDQATHFDVDTAAVIALERDDLGSGPGIGHRRQHTGPFGHVHRRPEQVHGLAAGPHPGQRHPLHHGHREPVPGQPVRRCRPGDTGTGDQDPQRLAGHVAPRPIVVP